MGGRGGKGGTGDKSRLARAEQSVEKQIVHARGPLTPEESALEARRRGLPFSETQGGVLNNTQTLTKAALDRMDAHLQQMNMQWNQGLSDAERQAIQQWNTPMYKQLTENLMSGNPLTPNQEFVYKNLMSAMGKSSVPENMTVWRGVKNNTSIAEAQAMVGKTWNNRGAPIATTLQWERAAHFTGDPSFGGNTSEGTMYKITVPKGAKGMWLNGTTGGLLNEHELLLSPNARFKVTGYSREKSKAGQDYSWGQTYNKEYTVLHLVYLGEKA